MLNLRRDFHLRRTRFRLRDETYPHWVLLCVTEGAFRFAVKDSITAEMTEEARFGDLVFTPPGFTLSREATSSHIKIHFFEFDVGGLPWIPPTGKVTVRGDDRIRLESNLARFEMLASYLPETAEDRIWRDHLMDDMLLLCRTACAQKEAEKTDTLMETAARLLRESFADRSFSLETLARDLALTPSGFSRRFGIAHGCTPSAYQSAWRLQQAQAMLLATDFTIDHVAQACGYRDGFYLCRVFRKSLRITPSAYRQRRRV
ncbi:MAG: helix-turn-helix transcriptional regulator [Fibrella sp.]|nr:helix-turn-helix transcriptional regulator [Armatimonadota bacterium]